MQDVITDCKHDLVNDFSDLISIFCNKIGALTLSSQKY